MSLPDTIRAMRSAGIPDDKIVETVLAMEEERLAKGRARTAKCRVNMKNSNVTRVTRVTSVTPVTKKEAVSPRPLSEEKNTPPSAPKGPLPPPGDSAFEKLWSAWQPHKTAKGSKKAAQAEWDRRVRKAGLDPGMVVEQAAAYCEECRRTDTNTQHIERWLKKHRWEDERIDCSENSGKRTTAERRREMLEGMADAGKLDPGTRPAEGFDA